MVRVTLVDAGGKPLLPAQLATSTELRAAAEQARSLSRDCDRLAQAKDGLKPADKSAVVPYLT